MIQSNNMLKIDWSTYKSSSFKKIFIPSYFESVVAFILAITDVLFLTAVDLSFVNAFAVIMNFMILSYISSQIAANIAASKVMMAGQNKNLIKHAHSNCLLLVFFVGGIYTIVLFLGLPLILAQSGVSLEWLPAAIVFSKIIAFNALCVALRKGINAIFSIHKQSKINLMTTLVIIILNLALNVLAYVFILEHSPTLYAYAIAGATIMSYVSMILILFYILWKKDYLETMTLKHLASENLMKIATMAKTSFVSSLESAVFIGMTYLFLVLMASINTHFLTIRNIVAPWFLLIIAIGQAWTVYANREISKIAVENHRIDLWKPAKSIMVHSLFFTGVGCFLLSMLILALQELLPLAKFSWTLVLVVLLWLSSVNIFRCVNVVTLTIFRLANQVRASVYLAMTTQAVAALLFLAIWLSSPKQQDPSFSFGLLIFFILIAEEASRTVFNLIYFKSNAIKIT